jgi:hypothetical protein
MLSKGQKKCEKNQNVMVRPVTITMGMEWAMNLYLEVDDNDEKDSDGPLFESQVPEFQVNPFSAIILWFLYAL